MCTVSWLQQTGGYHLLCNRDEKLTRGAGLGPRIEEREGVRFITPADGDFGGTWIAVNAFGLSLCLLNRGQANRLLHTRSRGLVVRELIGVSSVSRFAAALKQIDLSPFAPFSLVALEPARPSTLAEWNGEQLTMVPSADLHVPLVSSSYDPEGVRRHRRDEFERRVGAGSVTPTLLYQFHSSHGQRRDAYSACMHRTEAATVSFSWVVVTPDEIRFFYAPMAPCQWSRGEQQVLSRAA